MLEIDVCLLTVLIDYPHNLTNADILGQGNLNLVSEKSGKSQGILLSIICGNPDMAFVYAWIVPLWADQVLLQLLMEQFDTLRTQCRHIEHMHEGVYNFCLHRFY